MRWTGRLEDIPMKDAINLILKVGVMILIVYYLNQIIFSDVRVLSNIQTASWAQCKAICKSDPVEVTFHFNGSLASCSCDVTHADIEISTP